MTKCYDCEIEIDVEGEGVHTFKHMEGEYCWECAHFIQLESHASARFEKMAHGDSDYPLTNS